MEVESANTNQVLDIKIEELLIKEKTARQNNEFLECAQILKQIVQIYYDAKEYERMFEIILFLSKKRGQPKKALIDMVQLSMSFIPHLELETRLKLISTLKDVCDKKIFLEVEYARCCLMMVKYKEDENNINEAAKILQEVQVETYGSMDKREKLEFILYQMRIMIKKLDYVRLYIISKKISRKSIEEAGFEDLKILFYSYLIFYFIHEKKFLETAECYKKIFDTLSKSEEIRSKIPKILEFNFNCEYENALYNYVLFLIISSYSKDQVQLLNDLKLNYLEILEKFENLKNAVDSILSTELISTNFDTYNLSNTEIFSKQMENHLIHKQNFKKQLIQHNLRIIQTYYDRIHFKRVANLLNVDVKVCEEEICEMINKKMITAKIDRISGIVNFKEKKNENAVINDWVYDVNKLMDVIDKTCNLIKRENEEGREN